jgi:hypothetical protein
MKKQPVKQSLKLNVQTIATLTEKDLVNVQGGTSVRSRYCDGNSGNTTSWG